MIRPNRPAALVAVAASSLLAVAACGSTSSDASGSGGTSHAKTIAVSLTSKGCTASPSKVAAGALTFTVKNTDATAVSEVELQQDERILGEKENLAPGFGGTFALRLDGGTYRFYCPGATSEYTTFVVTGKAGTTAGSTATLLAAGTKTYGTYIESQTALLKTATTKFVAAVKSGNLKAAQEAYAAARPYYERVEPVAESFTSGKTNLDANIDARINDVPAKDFEGFHYLERGLFQAKSTKGLDSYAAGLQTNVDKLDSLVQGLTYQPAELLNGAGDLLDEVSKSKITGEEERYSHIDVLDFQANVEGAEQAFANVEPGLAKIDPDLAKTIKARFAAVDTLLDHYRDASALGGFVSYPQLTAADKKKMSDAVTAVKEPLSQAAGKVAAQS